MHDLCNRTTKYKQSKKNIVKFIKKVLPSVKHGHDEVKKFKEHFMKEKTNFLHCDDEERVEMMGTKRFHYSVSFSKTPLPF